MLARRSHPAVTAVVALDRRIDKGLQDLTCDESSEGERLDVEEAIARLQIALRLQYRAGLGYALGASSVVGFSYQHLGDALWHFAERELADARHVRRLSSIGWST